MAALYRRSQHPTCDTKDGTGLGMQAGIFVKSTEALQCFERVDTLLIDKSGTLTAAMPKLVGIETSGKTTEDDLNGFAASVEGYAEHPFANASVTASNERGLTLAEPEGLKLKVGAGVSAKVAGRTVVIGNAAQMESIGVSPRPPFGTSEPRRRLAAPEPVEYSVTSSICLIVGCSSSGPKLASPSAQRSD